MSHLLKNLLIALGVTLMLGAFYMLVVRKGTSEEGPVASQVKSESIAATENIISYIQEIDKYGLEDSIFDDPGFRSFKDYRVPVADVGTGRDNPFAPVE